LYGATIGRLGTLGIAATVNQACAAFVGPRHLETQFTYYWLQMRRSTIIALAAGGGQPNVSQDDLRQLRIPATPLCEQCAIAGFLDRETAKIDTLVAKKRTLIERLKEKRGALISRTVTRGLPSDAARAAGLDPHPKLKPTGIEWLGEVPAQLEIMQLKRACLVVDCMHRTVPFVDGGGIPLASIQEVHGPSVDLSHAKQTTEEEYFELVDGERKPLVGDIIYSRNATVGDAALVTTTRRFAMGQDVCLVRTNGQDSKYLLYVLRSTSVGQQVESFVVGATFRRINVGQIKTFWISVPPRCEQRAIVGYLDREAAKIDALTAKIETAIERLQEYRMALITAAVTGKIDVHGEH
jgi:restriction endonuclease S subunit